MGESEGRCAACGAPARGCWRGRRPTCGCGRRASRSIQFTSIATTLVDQCSPSLRLHLALRRRELAPGILAPSLPFMLCETVHPNSNRNYLCPDMTQLCHKCIMPANLLRFFYFKLSVCMCTPLPYTGTTACPSASPGISEGRLYAGL